MVKSDLINPGILEVICGPMFSGKTFELMHRVEKLNYLKGCKFHLFKPAKDTRDANIKTRFNGLEIECISLKKPEDIFDYLKEGSHLVGLDEVQFFQKEMLAVIDKLLQQDINVIAAGLDLDYRGETFGIMSDLLAKANSVEKLFATCFYPRCKRKASRTQRLIGGRPARYDEPTIVVEGSGKEVYEARCLKHHKVPGRC
ncbi:MAG: thymidine kinase [Patescibacteria group bacterium]